MWVSVWPCKTLKLSISPFRPSLITSFIWPIQLLLTKPKLRCGPAQPQLVEYVDFTYPFYPPHWNVHIFGNCSKVVGPPSPPPIGTKIFGINISQGKTAFIAFIIWGLWFNGFYLGKTTILFYDGNKSKNTQEIRINQFFGQNGSKWL